VVVFERLLPSESDFVVVNSLGMKLRVDGKDIPLNEFVEKIMQGVVVGGVTSLRGIKEDWKKIEIEILK
jgi:hypothetical protein